MNRNCFQQTAGTGAPLAFIGAYDAFSASLAAGHFDGLFVSGFGFAASHYGLPDIGFIAWPDIVAFVQRLRVILPAERLLVDIDDGYGDPEVASHVAAVLEGLGAFGVILEDQKRPRRCGHFDGKQLLDLDEYLPKLRRVLQARRDLVVVARTDSSDPADIRRRVRAFAEAGADAILVDGLRDLALLRELRQQFNHLPFVFNQIAGGKSPPCSLSELREIGASLVIYSTPCLFAAQRAIREVLRNLRDSDGYLPAPGKDGVSVPACTALLTENLARKSATSPLVGSTC
jgi:2-methylisocitrate lyase-like PEP mutase family enzyme